MSVMEIALLIIGVIIFVISFLLPEGNNEKSDKEIAAEKDQVRKMVEQEIDGMKLKVNEATNDTVEYAVDKAERSLEKVSNEKIMAVNEYAGTILEEINKNHKEVMFLYDMLRDKQADLTNVVREADAKVKEINDVSHNAQTASETLLRGMSVATVSQKGLTKEQKAIFDDMVIPEVSVPVAPVKKEDKPAVSEVKPKGVALAQSKIFAELTGKAYEPVDNKKQAVNEENQPDKTAELFETEPVAIQQEKAKETFAFDILSGSAYSHGNVVNVEPAGQSVTAADIAALMGGTSTGITSNDVAYFSKDDTSDMPENNNDKILELANQGLDTIDIAKTLGLGVGEVKLVLDLFR